MSPPDRDPSVEDFHRILDEQFARLLASEFDRPAPGPIDYSRGIRFERPNVTMLPADLIGRATGANYAEAFTANPWRDRFSIHTSTIGGATIPADLTAADILATMQQLAPAEPEHVIITPSIDALRAVVPFESPNAIQRRSPTDFRTSDGIRVVVTKMADRPRLVPASWLQTRIVDGIESFLDQLDAVADSPEPIVVVEGPPDAAPTP